MIRHHLGTRLDTEKSHYYLTRLTIKKNVRDTHRAIRLKTMRFLSLNASQLTIFFCCKKSIVPYCRKPIYYIADQSRIGICCADQKLA